MEKIHKSAKITYHNGPIVQWLFDGIKAFPEIFLFSSKMKLLNPDMKICLFFHWNPYLKTDSGNLLILFSVNDFHTNICKNFYVMFPAIVCIVLKKTKMQEIKTHKFATEQNAYSTIGNCFYKKY